MCADLRTDGNYETTSGPRDGPVSLRLSLYCKCVINHILLRCKMPNAARARRDSQKGKKGFSNQKGFTLVEVLIVIAVVAVLASLALPSYRTIIEKRQVTSGAEQISAFLSSAQFEAVKRGEPIVVRYDRNGAGEWCFGLAQQGNEDCNCFAELTGDPDADQGVCTIDGGVANTLTNSQFTYPEVLNAVSQGDEGSFTFDPVRGLLTVPTYDVDFELRSDNETYALHVQVNGTGRVKMCSGQDKAVPGYDPC